MPSQNKSWALEQKETNEIRKREVILKELTLLEEMRRLHEWTVFGQKEAEDEEKPRWR